MTMTPGDFHRRAAAVRHALADGAWRTVAAVHALLVAAGAPYNESTTRAVLGIMVITGEVIVQEASRGTARTKQEFRIARFLTRFNQEESPVTTQDVNVNFDTMGRRALSAAIAEGIVQGFTKLDAAPTSARPVPSGDGEASAYVPATAPTAGNGSPSELWLDPKGFVRAVRIEVAVGLPATWRRLYVQQPAEA